MVGMGELLSMRGVVLDDWATQIPAVETLTARLRALDHLLPSNGHGSVITRPMGVIKPAVAYPAVKINLRWRKFFDQI
jgi:hypothetical protein